MDTQVLNKEESSLIIFCRTLLEDTHAPTKKSDDLPEEVCDFITAIFQFTMFSAYGRDLLQIPDSADYAKMIDKSGESAAQEEMKTETKRIVDLMELDPLKYYQPVLDCLREELNSAHTSRARYHINKSITVLERLRLLQ
jgi:hypothetical protein